MKTDVIIVEAGPTGLFLAVQLIRYGIDFVIVDKKEDVTDLSKGPCQVNDQLDFLLRKPPLIRC